MDNGLKFPSCLLVVNHRRTPEQRTSGFVDWPSKGVGASRDLNASLRRKPKASRLESTGEKSSVGS